MYHVVINSGHAARSSQPDIVASEEEHTLSIIPASKV